VLSGAVISEKWIWNSVEGRDHAIIWVIIPTLGKLAAPEKWRDIHNICAEYKDKPRKAVVANFRLTTGHDCPAAHLTFRHHASSIQDRRSTTLQRTLFICLIKK
jgi:hypothetical protein